MRATEKSVALTSIMAQVLPTISFNTQKIDASLTDDLYATAAVFQHVADGMPFRDAYRVSADSPESWSDLARNPLSGLYQTPGQPGTENPDLIRNMAAAMSETRGAGE